MGFRKYIVRNRDNEAWLTHVYIGREGKVYQYMPDAGMAMQFETLHDVRRMAKECHGRAQVLKMTRKGEIYTEDIGK